MQLSSSPKAAGSKMVDAVEDDLVKRYENEKKEKEKQENATFMIFERHFEDKSESGTTAEVKPP
jgi:hypothetical protein